MAQKPVLVCDMCGIDPARRVSIIIDESAWRVDLCETHALLLDPVLIYANESKLPTRTRGPYEKTPLRSLLVAVEREEK